MLGGWWESFLPARRSSASWNGEGDLRLLGPWCCGSGGPRFRFKPRDSCAETRAPKDIEARACWGSVDSESEISDCTL